MTPCTAFQGLRCSRCAAEYPPEYLLDCPRCRGLLEAAYNLAAMRRHRRERRDGPGIWRWHFVLPVPNREHWVSLGEGDTPLLECPQLAREIGIARLWLKFEGVAPTGTIKDRSSATAVAAARQFGFPAIGVVSTGNAGSSLASYGARAGLRTFVFCYERGSQPKLNHMAACATDLIFYQGGYDDMIGSFDRLVEERLLFDGGATRNPYKHEGKKTLAYEVAEQFGWRAPAWFVAPVGVGETFIAAWRGFGELAAMGWIDGMPKMVAAQSALANPIVQAWRHGGELVPQQIGYTVAEGVAVGEPGAKGRRVLEILRGHGGVAGEATDAEVVAMQRLLARREGIWAGPTGCISLAALQNLARIGAVPAEAEVVCVVTETGLKGEYPPLAPVGISSDFETVRRLVVERLGTGPGVVH